MALVVERSSLQRSLRKMDLLATVQKYHRLCPTRAVCYSRMNSAEGMELVEVLVRQGFLEKNPNDGNGGGFVVTLSWKGVAILRLYREMLGLLEDC